MMLNIIYPKSQTNTSFSGKIPVKETVITSKKGRDFISSEFVGFYARRPGISDLYTDMTTGVSALIEKIFKVLHKLAVRVKKS